MAQIKQEILQSKAERQKFRHAPAFAPAGQSTQMIVGASDETDYHILKLSEGCTGNTASSGSFSPPMFL